MNQQSLKDYLNLIQKLLNCPKGQEWTLLQQHEKLINPELVGVMKQVAQELATEGNEKAAKFLSTWAAQLEEILRQVARPPTSDDRSQAYLNLIQSLIDCPKGAEAEILASQPALINPDLVRVMKQVANQLALQGDRETASFLSHLAAELNQTWLHANTLPSERGEIERETEVRPPQLQQPEPRQAAKTEREIPPTTSLRSDSGKDPHSSLSSDTEINEEIRSFLAVMARSLDRLNEILTARLPVADPLWYANVLEKAYQSQWTLTTEEVEKLIGIKPKCQSGKNAFQRGCWTFVGVGKLGSQTAWRVVKEEESLESASKLLERE